MLKRLNVIRRGKLEGKFSNLLIGVCAEAYERYQK